MIVDPLMLAFLGVVIVIIVSPGPDTAIVVRNTLLSGRRAGAATVVGVVCGIAAWALAAAVGLAAILNASAVAFSAMKIAGAVYLIALGVLTLRGSGRPSAADGTRGAPLTARRAWILGWLSASLNPKLGVFFLTLLPQFVQPGVDEPARLLRARVDRRRSERRISEVRKQTRAITPRAVSAGSRVRGSRRRLPVAKRADIGYGFWRADRVERADAVDIRIPGSKGQRGRSRRQPESVPRTCRLRTKLSLWALGPS